MGARLHAGRRGATGWRAAPGRARGGAAGRAGAPGPDAQRKQVRVAAEQARADVAEARRAWAEARPALDAARLVLLDETWATTAMARRYGWAPRGERALDSVPAAGHWKTSALVRAQDADGPAAPLVLDAARSTAARSSPTCAPVPGTRTAPRWATCS